MALTVPIWTNCPYEPEGTGRGPIVPERAAMPCGAELHPGHDASSAEIVAHIVEVHHLALRSQLLRIKSLLADIAANRPAREADRQQNLAALLNGLQQNLCDCLDHERCEIFPLLDLAEHGDEAAWPLLRPAFRANERSHARSLVTVWKLLDLARSLAAQERDAAPLVTELAAFSTDFCQFLFEEECLLFPRFTSTRSSQAAPAAAKPHPR